MGGKKRGRPTDNPKMLRVSGRLDEETYSILIKYCEAFNLSTSEALRIAIYRLGEDLKEEE